MLTSSIVSVANLENSLDWSPDYYRPEYLRLSKHLRAQPFSKIRAVGYVTDGEHGSPDWDSQSGIRYIAAEHVLANSLSDAPMRTISAAQDARNARCRVQINDILVYSVGAYAGLAARAEPHTFPASIPRSVAIIRLKPGAPFRAGFVSIFLNTEFGKFQTRRLRAGNSQPVLALEKIQQIELPHIPVELQDEVDQLYESAYQARQAALRSYASAESLLEEALGLNKLTSQKHTGYTAQASELASSRRTDAEYYNPAARAVVSRITVLEHTTVRESFDIQSGFPWSSVKFLPDNSGEPVVRIRNIKPNHILPDELTSIDPSYAHSVGVIKARKHDVVVGMDGIKYFYASLLEGECFVNQRVCHLSHRPSGTISPEYIVFIINSIVGQAQLMRDMTVATTVGHITNRDVAKLVVPTISQSFHDKITTLVRKSIDGKEESKRLLRQGKTRVEHLIEKAIQP
jgi:type I restriction enzyme S subunit